MSKSNSAICSNCLKNVNINDNTCQYCGYVFSKTEANSLQNEGGGDWFERTGIPRVVAFGCASLPIGAMVFIIIGIGSCVQESMRDSEIELIAQLKEQLREEKSQLLKSELGCKYGPDESPDQIRTRELAQVDIALAENVDNISVEREWEIRRSIGTEMGLAPHEVNGWKDIYRGRAEAAKRELEMLERERPEREAKEREEKQRLCDSYEWGKQDILRLQTEIEQREKALKS